MRCCSVRNCIGLVVVLACAFPVLKPVILEHLEGTRFPRDPAIGKVPVLSEAELAAVYKGKRALVIGGTRGVGYGTALAFVNAGADVAIVGRSEASGQRTLKKLRDTSRSDAHVFIQGDLGSVAKSQKLVDSLIAHAAKHGKFHYLVVTAAVFPNWSKLQQEDGLSLEFVIAVVGRYIVYRNMNQFLVPPGGEGGTPRLLNVLASGQDLTTTFEREIAAGTKNVTSLFESMNTFAVGNELMQIGLQENEVDLGGATCVSTHPGFLQTDLHRGQGFLFDLFENILVLLFGISEEDCGINQASILASGKLHPGALSYVGSMMQGRVRSAGLQRLVDEHQSWLWSMLNELYSSPSVK